ncbi:(2Fe-2S) ferredoxin domain-containing protein [uncultured Ferrovibrio sp.]|jgi:predicted metal-binding protein|uniref:(2Fe-2S) ferredoxin domain-containing protein n=1 Tax=uncultured Ferrovibrio sp. TaxID=1576913 RepID=UPI002624D43B|nr:(2Fe-2S) ferredoxin domain-containing protein [uncultured Ferrovibrio sp.]
MSRDDDDPVRPVEPDWSTALVLVCSECDGGRGADLASELRHAVKDAGHKKDVRVARCRCLGICPKHGVSVTVAGSTRPTRSYVAAPKAKGTIATLLSAILKRES